MLDKWDKRFMEMATLVGSWSSCLRHQIGAVVVRDRRILATGYNGAPEGVASCKDRNKCIRQQEGIDSGIRTELCYAVHAEQNAIAQAAKLGLSTQGTTLYCTHQPCCTCAKLIINAGIKRVVYYQPYPDELALALLEAANVSIRKVEPNEFVQEESMK